MIEARKKITEALISTRDGETNSIVKIVQAESASMTTGTISQQDRIEVMLKGIMNDINEIRNTADRTLQVKTMKQMLNQKNYSMRLTMQIICKNQRFYGIVNLEKHFL